MGVCSCYFLFLASPFFILLIPFIWLSFYLVIILSFYLVVILFLTPKTLRISPVMRAMKVVFVFFFMLIDEST